MTSGTRLRLATCVLALAPRIAPAAELDPDALLARLARPAPDATTFVEVRYSSLLTKPLVASGQLELSEDAALVRRVTEPYRETTVLRGEQVQVEREGAKARSFSLDRAPELRGMLASFGALLRGDRASLERYFEVSVLGTEARWRIDLVPRDAKLARRLAIIRVDGANDRPRCFTLAEPDDDASIVTLGVQDRTALPATLDRRALEAWCAGEAER
jgi:hypothetical protein